MKQDPVKEESNITHLYWLGEKILKNTQWLPFHRN